METKINRIIELLESIDRKLTPVGFEFSYGKQEFCAKCGQAMSGRCWICEPFGAKSGERIPYPSNKMCSFL